MTPMLQTSTALPYGFCAKTSGAKKNHYRNSLLTFDRRYLFFYFILVIITNCHFA